MSELTLSAIPAVLDDDEFPFVLGFGADPRRSLKVGGAEFRRGVDRCQIDWPAEPLALRASLVNAEGVVYLTAWAGPVLSEWWTLLQKAGANPQRPLLSAAVQHRTQTFTHDSLSVDISVAGPSAYTEHVAAVVGIDNGGITDDDLLIAYNLSLAVIKAALVLLAEYRTLVNPVPAVSVETNGGPVLLETVLDLAEDAAAFVAWTHQP